MGIFFSQCLPPWVYNYRTKITNLDLNEPLISSDNCVNDILNDQINNKSKTPDSNSNNNSDSN